jgi:hypothetical protein
VTIVEDDERGSVMTGDLFLVFSNPAPGQESAYVDWYEHTHLADVLKVPGVVAAQRYGVAPMKIPEAEGMPTPAGPEHRFLAVYELDRDPDEVMAEFLRRVTSGEMLLSDVLDLATVSMATWRPVGQRQEAVG